MKSLKVSYFKKGLVFIVDFINDYESQTLIVVASIPLKTHSLFFA